MKLAGVNIVAPVAWTFYPFDQLILARRDTAVGSLQLSTAFRQDLAGGASHADCLSLAQQFAVSDGTNEPFDIVKAGEGDTLFGAFSLTVSEDFKRAWYRYSKRQLILGVYTCPQSKSSEAGVELKEAEQIIRASDYATPSI